MFTIVIEHLAPFALAILITIYVFALSWSLTRKDNDFGYAQKSNNDN